METPQQSSPARLAAVIALVAATVVLLVIVVSALGGGGGSAGHVVSPAAAQRGKPAQKQARKVYVVKPGDCCLSSIAAKTGVDVDRLVQLNPGLDPQAIHSGDRVKLR
jgi:LysM repeat protein